MADDNCKILRQTDNSIRRTTDDNLSNRSVDSSDQVGSCLIEECIIRVDEAQNPRISQNLSVEEIRLPEEVAPSLCVEEEPEPPIPVRCDYRIDESIGEINPRIDESLDNIHFRQLENSNPDNACCPGPLDQTIPEFTTCAHLTEDESAQLASEDACVDDIERITDDEIERIIDSGEERDLNFSDNIVKLRWSDDEIRRKTDDGLSNRAIDSSSDGGLPYPILESCNDFTPKVWEDSSCDIPEPGVPTTTPVPIAPTTTPAPTDILSGCTYDYDDAGDCCPTNAPLECLKLERIIAGKNSTIIQANDNSYVLQVEQDKDNRKYKTFDPDTNYWLGGIFDSEDFIVDDFHANQKLNSSLPDSMDFRGPLGKIAGIAQCGDFSVLFKTGVTQGNHWQEGDEETNYVFEDLSIAVYDVETINGLDTTFAHLLSSELSDYDSEFSRTDIPPKTLSGITWGFLSEAPLALEYYDFDEGRLYGSSFKGKNPWNLSYDVSAKITHTETTNEFFQNAQIEDVRSYLNMNVGGGQAWMSYKVKDSYEGSRIINRNSSNLKDELLSPVSVSLSGEKTNGVFAYEHIERIAGIKRNISSKSHKSNIFSVRIKDSGLNESITDETIRSQTQDGLNKVIREVIEKIAPAHCQLWKIDWKGR